MENAEILQKSRESRKKLCESFRDCVFFCECVSKMENVCACFFNAGYLPMFRLY